LEHNHSSESFRRDAFANGELDSLKKVLRFSRFAAFATFRYLRPNWKKRKRCHVVGEPIDPNAVAKTYAARRRRSDGSIRDAMQTEKRVGAHAVTAQVQ
jgi:hypothetical protein